MPSIKKIFLVSACFFLSSFIIFSSQEPAQPGIYQWLKSFFISPQQEQKQKKFAIAVQKGTAGGKPLDLLEFYKAKEEKIKEKATSLIAGNDAQKFKKAVQENSSVMKWLKKNSAHNFLFGASSSSYQYEGGLDSNNANALFYQSKNLKSAGIAIDFWNRYKTDIPQMKNELGINGFRLSIAWERVQPDKEVWDLSMLRTYADLILTLKKNSIEPIVVLHHYTIPKWFAEIGGFEKAENIKYFVEFAKKMYEALHDHVTYWSTFNAIEGYAFKGYYKLDGPPGITKSLFTTQKVMYNMLQAHAQVYQAIKGSAGIFFGTNGLYQQYKAKNNFIPEPQIGIQKNMILFDPFEKENFCFYEKGFYQKQKSKMACTASSLLNHTMFFKLMRYRYAHTLDWIGINVYSNMELSGTVPQKTEDEERKTENINYRDNPEAIYRAVKIVSKEIAQSLNIPIIITENGIATKNDIAGNKKRELFFRRALYTIRKLIQEGYPIIGYTPWASHDNYEWPSEQQPKPYDRPYGFFHVDSKKKSPQYLQRTLKTGAYYYRDFIKEYFKQ